MWSSRGRSGVDWDRAVREIQNYCGRLSSFSLVDTWGSALFSLGFQTCFLDLNFGSVSVVSIWEFQFLTGIIRHKVMRREK